MLDRVKSYLGKLSLFSENANMLLSSTIIYSFGYGIYRVLFNLYILEIGFSGAFLGNLLAVNFAAAGISSIPAGKICDVIGRKNSMVISTAVITASMLVLITVEFKSILLFANIVRGSANAMRRISRYPFMMEQSDEKERMHLFSTAASLRMFAGVGGRVLAGILPTLILYYGGIEIPAMQNRVAMMITVLFIALSLIPLLKIVEEREYVDKKHLTSLKNWIKLKNPTLVKKLLVNSVFIGFGAGLIVQYFNVFFDQFIGMSRFQIGVLMAVGRSSMGISVFLLPILVSRVGKVRSVIITQLFSVPFLALMTILKDPYGVGAAYVMRTSLMNMNHPAFNNFMMEVTPESERGTVSGWNYFARRLSRGGGVLGGGYAIERKAYIFPFYITMICYVLGSVLYYYFFRKAKEGMKKAKWINSE